MRLRWTAARMRPAHSHILRGLPLARREQVAMTRTPVSQKQRACSSVTSSCAYARRLLERVRPATRSVAARDELSSTGA